VADDTYTLTADSLAPSSLAHGVGKREETKRTNRQAILDAARQVFGEMGYEAASVRDIIRRTPLSVGAFYNYYRSKEEVYEALSADGARRFKPILRAEYDKATDFDSFLRAALTAYFRFSILEHEAWQVMRPNGERSHPHVRVEGPEQKAVFDEVRAVIADGIERGLAPRVDADYLAAAAIGVAREVCERMIERRPDINLEAAVDFAHRMIQGGVAALPAVGE
jgi:AcrR family transcriptional regulator